MSIEAQPNSCGPVVLLSGGLDSTVALASIVEWGIEGIVAVTFDYGQINRANELRSAREIARYYGVDHRVIGLSNVFIPSALTGSADQIPSTPAVSGPDATFVPGRNIVLISVGVAIAQGSGAKMVVTGCNADDSAGYPDTTWDFMAAMYNAASAGYGVNLYNPLLESTKQDILNEARHLGVPVEMTWSCYRGGDTQCGNCGSCALNGQAAAL